LAVSPLDRIFSAILAFKFVVVQVVQKSH